MNDVNDRVQTLLGAGSRLAHIAGEHNTGIQYLIDFALTPWWHFKKRKQLKMLLTEYNKNE